MEPINPWVEFFLGQRMPAHGYCYTWRNDLVLLHVLSDGLIALAYFSIPVVLVYLVRKRDDLVFNKVFFLFAAFIFFCGLTHLANIWNIWHGAYWLSGFVKLITAAVSIQTAFLVWLLLPKILAIPSNEMLRSLNEKLKSEIDDKDKQKKELIALKQELEQHVEKQAVQLNKNEQRYRTLLENQSNVIWTTDPEGNFIEEQISWQKYTGQTQEQYRGRGWSSALHKDDQNRMTQTWAEAIRHCDIYRESGRLWNEATKSYRNIEVEAVPIIEKNEVLEWVGSIKDITEQKLNEERFRLALEAAPTAMLIVNKEGGIEHANQEASEVFGYSLNEITALSIEDLMPEKYRGAHLQHRQNYYLELSKRQMGRNLDLYAQHKNGSTFPVEVGLNPIVTSGQTTILCSVLDISSQRAHENFLSETNQKLQQSNQELEQFAYVASHDLKEPIRKISAFSQLLQAKVKDSLDESSQEYLQRIANAADRMGNLISNLLLYSRVSRGNIDTEFVSLDIILDEVLGDRESIIINTQALIERDKLPTINGVKSELYQLFSNLIGNALKFHPVERAPIVRVFWDKVNTISVVDSGIGIAPENQKRVFELFERLHNRNEYEGSGIGLSLCRKIVQNMGGKLILSSKLGMGCRFDIIFPASVFSYGGNNDEK